MDNRTRSGPREDLTGQRFGKLEVLGPAGSRSGRTAWRCRCDCGEETVVLGLNLRSGNTKSCGCLVRRQDLSGQRFGKLTAMEPAANVGGCTAWKCVCDCGNEVVVRTGDLRSGHTKSCGCLVRRQDLSGQRFGKLTAMEPAANVGGCTAWKCVCDCGNEVVVRTGDLRSGNTKSCGCLRRDLIRDRRRDAAVGTIGR